MIRLILLLCFAMPVIAQVPKQFEEELLRRAVNPASFFALSTNPPPPTAQTNTIPLTDLDTYRAGLYVDTWLSLLHRNHKPRFVVRDAFALDAFAEIDLRRKEFRPGMNVDVWTIVESETICISNKCRGYGPPVVDTNVFEKVARRQVGVRHRYLTQETPVGTRIIEPPPGAGLIYGQLTNYLPRVTVWIPAVQELRSRYP